MAPPSPWLIPHLHSTSGILACLDLNDNPNEDMEDMDLDKDMEDMDLDKVIEVPDTPDQIAARAGNYGEPVEKGISPSVHSGNSNYSVERLVARPKYRVRTGTENGHYRRLHFLPLKNPSNYAEPEHHQSDCTRAHHIDKGKALCSDLSSNPSASNPSACLYDRAVKNMNEQSRKDLRFINGILPGKSTNHMPKDIHVGSLESCGYSSKAVNSPCKMMEVTDDYMCEGGTSGVDCRERIDFFSKSQLEAEKSVSRAHSNIILHRVSGQKRLVRNGCISPHNIARAKQVAGKHDNCPKNIECSDTRAVLTNGSPCVSGVGDLDAEDNNANRVKLKGKGVLTQPPTLMEIPLSSRDPKNYKEDDGSVACYKDVSDSLQGLNGWISTRNRTKKIHQPCSDNSRGHLSRKDTFFAGVNRNTVGEGDNGSGINNKTACDYTEVHDVDSFRNGAARSTEVVSRLVSESDRVNGRQRAANTLIKRQRNQASASSHPGQCSTSVSNDTEIVCLDSPGESSHSISTGPRREGLRHRRAVHPVIEIDESPLALRNSASQDTGCSDNDSGARARQVEADERLARELQEQLYHESPVFSGVEVDAHVAWTLQQAEATHAPSGSHRNSLPRGSLTSHTYRQSHSRSNQINPIRRENRARIPTSNRRTLLNRRIQNQLPAAISGEGIPFPASMNLDMRMNILEALEAAVDGNMRSVTNILGVQRDFNENDYEMLLALDENNDSHSGAPVNLINSLPQTVVQTATFEEACAICLETPTTGDSIRHLPCLHKFHKDCIDPWLSRKTSCPVCKSSIR